MHFTAHNILLKNGKKTMDDNLVTLAQSALWSSIEQTVNMFFPQDKAERSQLRVVDLGCLEGGYTAEFAKLGFETIGIEAREKNLLKCNYVKNNLNLSNLHFVKDDVRNMADYGPFDITLCYGILYHLDNPVSFLKTIGNCTSKLLLLNTHFAPELDVRYGLGPLNRFFIAPLQKRTKLLEFQENHRLSGLTTHENYRGRWKREWSEKTQKNKIEKKYLWASYNNKKSFWLCKKDLTNAILDAGFDMVFEQFNFTGDIIPENCTHYSNRTMFVAIKQ